MHQPNMSYWEDLNQWLTTAFHQLAYIPACCIHAIESELKLKHGIMPGGERSTRDAHDLSQSSDEYTDNCVDQDVPPEVPHFCKNCGEDIIERIHTTKAQAQTKSDNISFHDWLTNEQSLIDLTKALPHASGFEQNLDGLKEAHLRRIEKYWAEHQFTNPGCSKPLTEVKLASVEEWEETKRHELELQDSSQAR